MMFGLLLNNLKLPKAKAVKTTFIQNGSYQNPHIQEICIFTSDSLKTNTHIIKQAKYTEQETKTKYK